MVAESLCHASPRISRDPDRHNFPNTYFRISAGGWLESEIIRIYGQIRSAAYEDTPKGSNDEFDAEVAANLDFARRRSGFTLSQLAEISGQRFFAITNPGGYSLTRGDAARPFYAGYAVVESDAPVRNPDGIAVITFRQDGVVVTETSVPASTPVERGLLYAEIDGPVKTGIAIANPSDREASISFFFTDADGRNVGQGNLVIPARGQIARFLDQDPFNSGLARGTFNFESSTPAFVIALRGLTNERSEFILSTLPIVDLTATPGPPVIPVIPHFVDGEGWTTQIILVNPLHQPMQGTIRFFDQQGITSSPYTIAPGGYYRLQTAGTESTIRSGYAQIVPAGNAPAAFGVFSFRKNGVTVTESSVRAVEAAAVYRTYVEMLDGVQTGIAIANPSSTSITVGLEATLLPGSPSGMSGTLTIPANGHVAFFLNEIPGFERMTAPFQGVLRISTPASSGIAVAGLRGRTNERGDFLISTIPSVDESVEATTTRLVFPHFVEGSGYTTQFILFSGAAYWTPTGVLRLYDQTGLPISAW